MAKSKEKAPNGWAWVGEAGPELVKFRGGETILPNEAVTPTSHLKSGDDIHIYLDGNPVYSGPKPKPEVPEVQEDEALPTSPVLEVIKGPDGSVKATLYFSVS